MIATEYINQNRAIVCCAGWGERGHSRWGASVAGRDRPLSLRGQGSGVRFRSTVARLNDGSFRLVHR